MAKSLNLMCLHLQIIIDRKRQLRSAHINLWVNHFIRWGRINKDQFVYLRRRDQTSLRHCHRHWYQNEIRNLHRSTSTSRNEIINITIIIIQRKCVQNNSEDWTVEFHLMKTNKKSINATIINRKTQLYVSVDFDLFFGTFLGPDFREDESPLPDRQWTMNQIFVFFQFIPKKTTFRVVSASNRKSSVQRLVYGFSCCSVWLCCIQLLLTIYWTMCDTASLFLARFIVEIVFIFRITISSTSVERVIANDSFVSLNLRPRDLVTRHVHCSPRRSSLVSTGRIKRQWTNRMRWITVEHEHRHRLKE